MKTPTPGPWWLSFSHINFTYKIESGHVDNPVTIASGDLDGPESEANVRLMAASPLLLEALEASLRELPLEAAKTRLLIESAIAYAKGR